MTNSNSAQDVARWAITDRSDQAVIENVDRILEQTQPRPPELERRKDKRIVFPHLVTLTPLSDDELVVTGDPVTVIGKYLAGRGFDFYHFDPLPFKRAIVSFESGLREERHLVISISWCRFLRPGWYDSGGRFTHVVTPESAEDWAGGAGHDSTASRPNVVVAQEI